MRKLPILNYAYILFLAIYPVLALRQANIVYANMPVTIRSIGLTLLLTALLWLLLRWVLKDWHKAGILTSMGIVLFYSYGHVYLWALEKPFGPLRHSTLIIAFSLLMGVLTFIFLRLKNLSALVQFLNTTSFVLIGLLLIQAVFYASQTWRASKAAEKNHVPEIVINSEERLPDIYLIILDAHTRSDVLLERYNYDNSDFITSLKSMGFYVADCSQSNYPGTNFSILSMMNLDYFYNLFDKVQVIPPLKSSVVSATLRDLGYTVVAFENRASGHFDLLEDVHLSRNATLNKNVALSGGINEFESMLIETSLLRIFVDMPQLLPDFLTGDFKDAEFYEHYQQTYYILDQLKDLSAISGPKFVMAHILTPHDPYIFSPDGGYEPSGALGPIAGYRNNVRFIDNFLPETLDQIIKNSERSPIIIIMGDHGPTGKNVPPEYRVSILNAYYMNEKAKASLYPTITPINSFRVIFNAYFDTQYPLREDHSYYVWNNNQMLDQKNEIINLCQP